MGSSIDRCDSDVGLSCQVLRLEVGHASLKALMPRFAQKGHFGRVWAANMADNATNGEAKDEIKIYGASAPVLLA